MHRLVLLGMLLVAPLAVVACSKATMSRLDDRTFRIEGPEVPGGSDAPNRRLADQVCPHGYRVLDSAQAKRDSQSPPSTNWTVRCL